MRGGEQWRDIPGYGGWYQVSNTGQVRTWHRKDGRGRSEQPKAMKQYKRNGCQCVSLRSAETGNPRMHTISSLVFKAFVGPVPKGRRVLHRSFNMDDNRPENLILGCRADQARRMHSKAGTSRRKPVLKMNLELEVMAVYSSAREADKKNHFGESVLNDYCNLKRKSVIAKDGYIYAWDDDRWLTKTLRRARAELDALGIRYNDPFTSRYYDLQPEPEPADDPSIPWDDAPALAGGGRFRAILRP